MKINNSIKSQTSKTIVFIHGMFLNPYCWDSWIGFFQKHGYTCYAPAYPMHIGSPGALRLKPHENLGNLNFNHVLQSLTDYIAKLPEKPILIGHAMGALFVQKLINLNIGLGGICLSSAPPYGISCFKCSFLKHSIPILNSFKKNLIVKPSLKWFHSAFCNSLSIERTYELYKTYVVPESRNILRTSRAKEAVINFNLKHTPLLFIAASNDSVYPPVISEKIFSSYTHSQSIKSIVVFPDRYHFIICQENWQEIAAYVISWIESNILINSIKLANADVFI